MPSVDREKTEFEGIVERLGPTGASQAAFHFSEVITRLCEPQHVLETGSGVGSVSVSIMRGLAYVRKGGSLWTVEIEYDIAWYVHEHLQDAYSILPKNIHLNWTVVNLDSRTFTPPDDVMFDLCWFDTGFHKEEFDHYYDRMSPGSICVFMSAPDDLAAHIGDRGVPFEISGPDGISLVKIRNA